MTKLSTFQKLWLYTAFMLLLLAFPALALAQEATRDTDVTIIPPSVFQDGTILAFATTVAAAIYKIIEKLMGPWGWAAKLARLDQVITKYLSGGIAKYIAQHPELATKGLTIDAHSAVVAEILNPVLTALPGWAIRFAGGKDGVIKMIENRLPKVFSEVLKQVLPA